MRSNETRSLFRSSFSQVGEKEGRRVVLVGSFERPGPFPISSPSIPSSLSHFVRPRRPVERARGSLLSVGREHHSPGGDL